MATENPVFQVLVPSGNQALMAAGSRMDSLAVGQLGIFNFHTGMSIDGTVPKDAEDIFIAVGINRNGTGGGATLEDVGKSAGQMIQTRRAKSYTLKGYVSPLPNIWEITGFGAKCETDYSIKIEMRSQQSYGINGYNQFANTYNFRTGCCTEQDCATCPQGDPNELAAGLVAAINADPDAIQVASLFANKLNATVTAAPGSAAGNVTILIGTTTYVVPLLTSDNTPTLAANKIVAAINTTTGSPYKASNAAGVITVYPLYSSSNPTVLISLTSAGGTGVTMGTFTVANVNITDLPTFEATYPGAAASIRITANAAADVPFNGNIPVKYYSSRDQKLIISLTDGFDCNGTATEVQTSQIEDGNGRQLALAEYEAGGFNGKPGPYRTSAVTGLQKGNYDQFINPTANYNQVVLSYDQFSVGGWGEFLNNLETIIAIPCADGTTLTSLVGILDLIFTQFLTNATLAGTLDCTNVITSALSIANSGIRSLA